MNMLCALGWHQPKAMARWNGGYYFSTCRRCGRDLVRTAYEGWQVPRGYRVVWSATPPKDKRVANLAFEPPPPEGAAGLRIAPDPVREAPLELSSGGTLVETPAITPAPLAASLATALVAEPRSEERAPPVAEAPSEPVRSPPPDAEITLEAETPEEFLPELAESLPAESVDEPAAGAGAEPTAPTSSFLPDTERPQAMTISEVLQILRDEEEKLARRADEPVEAMVELDSANHEDLEPRVAAADVPADAAGVNEGPAGSESLEDRPAEAVEQAPEPEAGLKPGDVEERVGDTAESPLDSAIEPTGLDEERAPADAADRPDDDQELPETPVNTIEAEEDRPSETEREEPGEASDGIGEAPAPEAAPGGPSADDFMADLDDHQPESFWSGADAGTAEAEPAAASIDLTPSGHASEDTAAPPDEEVPAVGLEAPDEPPPLEPEAAPAEQPAQQEEPGIGAEPLPQPTERTVPKSQPAPTTRTDLPGGTKPSWPSAAPTQVKTRIVGMDTPGANHSWKEIALAAAVLLVLAVIAWILLVPGGDDGSDELARQALPSLQETESANAVVVPPDAGQAFVSARLLNCRASPVLGARSLRVLARGDAVRVLAREPGWVSVAFEGRQCWVADRYLSATRPL